MKYFDRTSVSGEILEVDGRTIQIMGVYDFPDQSHVSPNMVIALSSVASEYSEAVLTNWSSVSHFTYVRLASDVDAVDFEEQLNAEVPNFYPGEELPIYSLQPITSIHLTSDLSFEFETNGNWSNLYYLAAAAILILIIASINYINITFCQCTQAE